MQQSPSMGWRVMLCSEIVGGMMGGGGVEGGVGRCWGVEVEVEVEVGVGWVVVSWVVVDSGVSVGVERGSSVFEGGGLGS